MKKKIFIYVLLFSFLSFFLYQVEFDFKKLANLETSTLIVLSFIYILGFYSSALFYKIGLKSLGVKEKTLNYFYYSTASQLLNYLPLKVNLIFLGGFLKKKHNLAISKYLFFILMNYSLIFSAAFFLGLYTYFYSDIEPFINYFQQYSISKIVIVSILGALFFLIIGYRLLKKRVKIEYFNDIFFTFKNYIKHNIKTIIYLQIIVLSQIILFGLRLFFIYSNLDIDLSFNNCLLLGVCSIFSFLFSVTPGGLGIKESLQGYFTYILIGNFEIGAIVALLDRTLNLLWTVLIGSYSIKFQLKEFLEYSEKIE